MFNLATTRGDVKASNIVHSMQFDKPGRSRVAGAFRIPCISGTLLATGFIPSKHRRAELHRVCATANVSLVDLVRRTHRLRTRVPEPDVQKAGLLSPSGRPGSEYHPRGKVDGSPLGCCVCRFVHGFTQPLLRPISSRPAANAGGRSVLPRVHA